MSWLSLYDNISSREYQGHSSKAIKRYMLHIVETAWLWELDEDLSNLHISTLRTIASRAKEAIRQNDRTELKRLLRLCRDNTVTDLRLIINGHRRDIIPVVSRENVYVITANEDQFRRIEKDSRRSLNFSIV